MAHLPTGVTVVTALAESGPAGATANAVGSLSLEPPLVVAALDRGSRTLAALRSTERFGVNVLGASGEGLARAFATKAPHAEKWADVAWAERAGIPVLDRAVLWVACSLRDLHDGGDHVIVTGLARELGGEGGAPLVFHAGGYRGLD